MGLYAVDICVQTNLKRAVTMSLWDSSIWDEIAQLDVTDLLPVRFAISEVSSAYVAVDDTPFTSSDGSDGSDTPFTSSDGDTDSDDGNVSADVADTASDDNVATCGNIVISDDDTEPDPKRFRFTEDPPARRLRDKTLPYTGQDDHAMGVFQMFCMPPAFYFILAMMNRVAEGWNNAPDLVGMEFYAGKARLTQAFQTLGLRFLPFDIIFDNIGNDIISAVGLMVALSSANRIKEDGLLWQGTVCSSFIWLARATTSRTWLLPRGDENVEAVWKGNIMAARTALLIVWAYARNLSFVVEQPHSSLLWRHPALRWVANVASENHKTWHGINTFMSCFAAKTPKPTVLYSNASWIFALARSTPTATKPSKTASVTIDAAGRRVVTGNRDGTLKATQTYTRAFGKAVQNAWASDKDTYSRLQCINPSDAWFDDPMTADEAWEDLDLEPLVVLLRDQLTGGSRYVLDRGS